MSTHSVALNDVAYRRLREIRGKGESFSDVIERITGPRKHLADFAGAWGKLTSKQFEEMELERKHRKELGRAHTRRIFAEGGR